MHHPYRRAVAVPNQPPYHVNAARFSQTHRRQARLNADPRLCAAREPVRPVRVVDPRACERDVLLLKMLVSLIDGTPMRPLVKKFEALYGRSAFVDSLSDRRAQ
jgi:hypothetical protein